MSELTCSCCGTDPDRTDEQLDERPGDRTDDRIGERTDGGATATDGEPTGAPARPIPDEMGELIATAYGMASTPVTLGDWVEGLQTWARENDLWPPSFDDLCHADDSSHVLELDGETHHFHCVLDPLMAPGLLDPEEIVVHTASPLEGAEVEIRIANSKIEMVPSTAVLSLGASRSIERLGGDEFAPEIAYEQLCAYANAFPNRTTYDAWAAETPEAATMAIPLLEGVELARAIVADE